MTRRAKIKNANQEMLHHPDRYEIGRLYIGRDYKIGQLEKVGTTTSDTHLD